jgi:hypothetical protein
MLAAIPSLALDIRSFNLTESEGHIYDANEAGRSKTEAQLAVDYMHGLGVNHVLLTPVATMASGISSVVIPNTKPGSPRTNERERYLKLIHYIHSKGMTVGIRPIVLVQRSDGNDPIWHGNMQPQDPLAWFNSMRTYLNIYANIAKMGKVEEFTIAAELYSMTVGLEDQWKEQPYGFPREWTGLIRDLRGKLAENTRIMYDINYTDQTKNDDGTGPSGGEMERWRYRLVDLKPKSGDDPYSPTSKAWEQLKDLWLELDMVGVDMYRSLMPKGEVPPSNYSDLVSKLQSRSEEFASDLDSKLLEIEQAVGGKKQIVIKEVGFKSCTGCFVDPFVYDDQRKEVNIAHQAASYESIFNSFVIPQWSWLSGVAFWDVSVNPSRSGMLDPGFSPRGKSQTEEVIRKGWGS